MPAGATAQDFAALIAEHVPTFVLLELNHPEVVLEVDAWRKNAAGDPAERLIVATKIVNAFDQNGLLSDLAGMLYRRLNRDDLVAAKFVPFATDKSDNQQAALAYRALMLQQADLRQFLAECEPRVCMIFAPRKGKPPVRGTGFLVGPNLIMTAYHVVKHSLSIPTGTDADLRCFAVFDHISGRALNDVTDVAKPERKVLFAEGWQTRATFRMDLKYDGTVADPDENQQNDLKQKLDFAVIELAEDIGLEACARNGGRRRLWFTLQEFGSLDVDQRIIIPQHPMGFRQQIDFGRFKSQCKSGTRIRYDTETSNGSSGAPCFDETYRLVGMHNAAYRPHGPNLFNQAIRSDCIAALWNSSPASNAIPPAQIWSITETGSKPILGRRKLIEWIDRAAPIAATLADQTFAVEGSIGRSGRAFSIEILREKVRERGDPVIELGTTQVPMPAKIEDLIATIIDQLALPRTVLDGLPPRPDKDASDGSKKSATWASKEVPNWLDGLLASQRQFTVNAFEYVKNLKKCGEEAFTATVKDQNELQQGREYVLTPAQQAIFDAGLTGTIATTRTRWELIWIAFRLRTGQTLPDELKNLFTSIARKGEGNQTEFGRLRWLFIETIPEFASATGPVETEILNPLAIGEAELRACWKGLANAAAYPYDDNDPVVTTVVYLYAGSGSSEWPPEQRLPAMQKLVAQLAQTYTKAMIQRRTVSAI